MNALKQEGLGLLDYLVIKTGCMYLSDLSQKEMLCEIQHAVRELDPEAFSPVSYTHLQTPEDSQGGSLRDWLNQFGF